MRKPVNYINNKSLYTAMVEHRTKLEEAERNNKEKPQVSNYIGLAIMKICENLGKKGCFSGYSYIKDMISDGIMDCVAAVNNFNPDKTNNPFAYFTQVAWNAFLRRIEKEKKQTYIKHKNYQNQYMLEDMGIEQNNALTTNEYSDDVIKNFENKLTKKAKSANIKGVEKFIEKEKEENENTESTSST